MLNLIIQSAVHDTVLFLKCLILTEDIIPIANKKRENYFKII